MSDDRKDLPSTNSPMFLDRAREVLSVYLGKRGDPLDRGVTLRDLADSGIVALTPGFLKRPGSYTPIAGPGTGIGATEPDLTPPPMPTGVTVTATFSNLIIEHDSPVYTQGHGHARTRVYGKTYAGGALPIFSGAVLITEFVGTVFAHPTTLGTEWHLWITWVTVDGVESVIPAGSTNGYSATTGLVGGHDLGPLIVDAANLASGAVTASKIAATAVDLTKFANGIEPVTIITSGTLPTMLSTKFIFWTDLKLYRWNGSAYIKTVDGADIVANSITAGQIQAGAIGTTELAAGAVTTGKLLVTGRGKALNDDPSMSDASAWILASGTATFAADATSPVGSNSAQATNVITLYSRVFPIEAGKTYKVAAWVKQNLPGILYLRLRCQTTSGTDVNYVVTGTNPTGSFEGRTPASTAWIQYIGYIVAGAGSVKGFLEADLNWSTTGTASITDFRCEEYIGADLIVDGAIVAGKIAANAIVAGDGVIQNAAITNALIANLAVDNAKIADMSVAKLTAGSLQVGSYLRSTSYVAGTSGWAINADGTAELGAAYIRGQLVASQIDTRNLTIKDGSGTVIFGAGTALNYANITPAAGWLNSNVTISSGGALSGAGGGSVTISGLGYSGDLDATKGAQLGTNLKDSSGTVLGDSAIKNSAISFTVNSNGTLSITGGPSASGGVTLTGLGAGAMAAIDQITAANASTYIGSAAIDLANIKVASITTLGALSSYLGTVDISSGGYLRSGQTAWSTGSGFWIGWVGSGPGEPGFSIGSSTAYLRYKPSTGLELQLNSFYVTLSTTSIYYGNYGYPFNYTTAVVTTTVTGGTGSLSYFWTLTPDVVQGPSTLLVISPTTSSTAFTAHIQGASDEIGAWATCTVTDSNGRVAQSSCYILVVETH